MWMSNFTDEAKFDEFRKTITWEGSAEKIKVPYLAMAGESDELCPLRHTEAMLKTMSGPRQFVVYQDCRHALGGVPSVTLGPQPTGFVANWMAARFAGKPLASERWYVDTGGKITKTPL
jgi:alpha-beta hydrolase superfamily lysophospholipase